MKILYVAKHNSGDNDDEGSIAFALRQIGHSVECVHELRKHRSMEQESILRQSSSFDLCLFHKWATVSEVSAVKCPKVFWYFDMVRPVDNDPTLAARSQSRVKWMGEIIPLCHVGFCTDGDWVDDWNSTRSITEGLLTHLMQGMDEQVAGRGTPIPNYDGPEILFTGMINHGQKRAAHVAHLHDRYGSRFGVLGDGGPRHRIHGRALADVFASTHVVVAPDGPNTDRYCSNRVFLTTGLGGFLLHPKCALLRELYHQGELLEYRDWDHLDRMIDYYLTRPQEADVVRDAGLAGTMERNLCRHRCAQLIDIVKERL